MKRVAAIAVLALLLLAVGGPAGAEPDGVERLKENEAKTVAASQAYAAMVHGGMLGDNAPAARLAAAQQAAAIVPAPTVTGTWTEVGPSPYNNDDPTYPASLGPFGVVTGQVISLAVDPSNASVVYAGGASGGIWKTTDGGGHWHPVGDHLASMAIGALAIDPSRPTTVFAGTGDANTNFDAYSGAGVYRSTDAGATWTRVDRNIGAASTVFHIEIAGGRLFVATNKGLYRSADGGDSYERVALPTNAAGTAEDPGVFSNFITDVRVKPGTPDEVTAAVGWRAGETQSPGNGLYRSTTGGGPGSFTRMTTTGLGLQNEGGDPLGRISLAYASGADQDHDILWAVVQDAGKQHGDTFLGAVGASYTVLNGIFRSGDDGATWDVKATPEELLLAPGTALFVRGITLYAPGVQSWYNQWIAVDPSNADTVLLGLEEIYKTTANANGPGPATWQTIGRYAEPCPEVPTLSLQPCPPALDIIVETDLPHGNTTHPDQHAAALVPTASGTRAYIGSDGGVWRQDASGGAFDNDHWAGLNDTLRTLQPYRAAMSGDGTIYFGLQDNGVGKTTGPTTGSAVLGGDGMNVAVNPADAKIAYAEGPYGDLNRTSDGGVTWDSIGPSFTQAQFVTPFDLDRVNPKHFLIAAREVYATANVETVSFDTWTQVFDLGANADGFDNSATASGLHGAAAYVGFCGVCDPITQSENDVSKFHNGIATNVKPGCTADLATAACWHKATAAGLPNRIVTDVAVDPNDPRTVFVTLGGYGRRWYAPPANAPGVGVGHVYVSHDAGETFSDVSTNLPDSPATTAVLRDNAVIVGTDDGVFVATRSGAGLGAFAALGAGLPHVPIWDVQLSPAADRLVAATHGRGVWVFAFAAGRNVAVPTGVIPATGRALPTSAWWALSGALLLRAVTRGRRGSRRRPARSAA